MTEIRRANRITVATADSNLTATYWRTHKKIATLTATEMGYESNDQLNATANRELFRLFAIENAGTADISYDPIDRRTDSNRFPTHWTDEQMVQEWAYKMVERDMAGWMSKISPNLAIEEIALVGLTNEERYANKDAIKSATIEMDAHIFDAETQENTAILITLEIRSGQMTKPQMVSSEKWNYTNFRAVLTQDMVIEESTDMADMTKPQLKQMVADDGLVIKGISKLTKPQLIEAIEDARAE